MAAPMNGAFRARFLNNSGSFCALRACNRDVFTNRNRQLSNESGNTAERPPPPANKRVIFSGIQPTGHLHLGNYFGAVSHWVDHQNAGETQFISIVDLHSITLPQDPAVLRSNVLLMTASLLACGINPQKTTLFLQSMVPEHAELAWILGCLTTMLKLGHLPQYKEKSSKVKEIPLGLFVYPVLQSADILLYKATHVPVGEDQLQHIQLAQHLAKAFNRKYGKLFPSPAAQIVDNQGASRLRSLRDPTRKMSKSDPDPRSRLELTDSADTVCEKLRKAVSDFDSRITYEPETRPSVTNLVHLQCLLSGRRPERVVEDAALLDTVAFKARLADSVNARLTPIREEIARLTADPAHLESVLRDGAARARHTAADTWSEVRQRVGLL